MPILFLIVLGAAVGFVATRMMGVEMRLLPTIAIGMAGGVIGGLVFRFLTAITGAFAGIIGALLGALLLVWLWKRIGGSSK